ncbi:MAG: hypothetical protein ACI3Z0_11370 [Candidatus Cryptobacteroides sp.]
MSFKDFTRIVSDESGCKKVGFFLPGKLAYFIAKKMQKKAAKKGSKPQMTAYAVWNLMRNNVFSSEKAIRELGYHMRSYRETIHDQIQWFKSEGLI